MSAVVSSVRVLWLPKQGEAKVVCIFRCVSDSAGTLILAFLLLHPFRYFVRSRCVFGSLQDFLNPCWNKTRRKLVKGSASSCGHLPSSPSAGCLSCPPARGSATDYQLHPNGSPGPCSLLARCRRGLILVLCSSITERACSSLIPLTTLGLFGIMASPWPKLLITV